MADQIGERVASQGLRVDYLHCPSWHGGLPHTMACTGYLDGVTATVKVRLHRVAGHAISYDATLGAGVFATATLVDQLVRQGFHQVDCGTRAAYPTRVGEKIVCEVSESDQHAEHRYVVATVTSRDGTVRITHYR
ncbi:MAG TPA: hypothetical protein VFJ19_12685 [Nocardioidaceae bacterium]|nr:hypothetical protein [Nocardioidaceae bacterium]